MVEYVLYVAPSTITYYTWCSESASVGS